MSTMAGTMRIDLPLAVRPVLENITGNTPDQKIAHLLHGELRRNLQACEHEQLELEIKYGLEYEEFVRRLQAGELGDEFAYDLEMDAIRWSDLTAEKRHWLRQMNLLRSSK